jgi:hypothetical protein
VSIVRKTIAIVGLVLCSALLLPVGFVADRGVAVAFLIATCIAPGLFISNVWAITQTLAGPDVAKMDWHSEFYWESGRGLADSDGVHRAKHGLFFHGVGDCGGGFGVGGSSLPTPDA